MFRFSFILPILVLTLWGCIAQAKPGAFRDDFDSAEAELQIVNNDVDKLSGELKRVRQEVEALLARLQKENEEIEKLLAQSDPTKAASAAKEAGPLPHAGHRQRVRKHGYRSVPDPFCSSCRK